MAATIPRPAIWPECMRPCTSRTWSRPRSGHSPGDLHQGGSRYLEVGSLAGGRHDVTAAAQTLGQLEILRVPVTLPLSLGESLLVLLRTDGRSILGHMARPDEHIVEHGLGQRAGEGIPLARVIGTQQHSPLRRHRFRSVTKRRSRPEAEFAGHNLMGELTERDDDPPVSEPRELAAP